MSQTSKVSKNNTKYNGWTNYETWNCKLWIDNDESTQCFWAERADDCFSAADDSENFTRIENATFTLADELENHYDENMEEMVNWHEIAESLLEDVVKMELVLAGRL